MLRIWSSSRKPRTSTAARSSVRSGLGSDPSRLARHLRSTSPAVRTFTWPRSRRRSPILHRGGSFVDVVSSTIASKSTTPSSVLPCAAPRGAGLLCSTSLRRSPASSGAGFDWPCVASVFRVGFASSPEAFSSAALPLSPWRAELKRDAPRADPSGVFDPILRAASYVALRNGGCLGAFADDRSAAFRDLVAGLAALLLVLLRMRRPRGWRLTFKQLAFSNSARFLMRRSKHSCGLTRDCRNLLSPLRAFRSALSSRRMTRRALGTPSCASSSSAQPLSAASPASPATACAPMLRSRSGRRGTERRLTIIILCVVR